MSFVRRLTLSSLCILSLGGCVRGLTQVAGTGSLYYTRCSADMLLIEGTYRTQCEPEACRSDFTSGPVNHVVVAMDPGRKLVGLAERICIQDLARASGLFNPLLTQEDPDKAEDPSSENEP